MLIDTHAHIQDTAYDEDRADVIARATGAGVLMLTVGVDIATSRAAVALATSNPGIYAAVGVHPHEATSLTPAVLDELRRLCLHPKVVAIGETGLDWYRNLSPKAAQLDAFNAHLTLAAEVDLPVIIHNRDADEDILRAWRSISGVRGVMHNFSSGEEMAEAVLAAAMYISLAGPITYKTGETTRAVARLAPLDRLLIETDCPYLSPVPWRGQRNEPAHVTLIAEALARVRGLPVGDVAAATVRNAQALFRLPVARN
jgi:TatD DNase family protein